MPDKILRCPSLSVRGVLCLAKRISVEVFTRAGGQNVRCFGGKTLQGLSNSIKQMGRRNMFYLRPFNQILHWFLVPWVSVFGAACAWQLGTYIVYLSHCWRKYLGQYRFTGKSCLHLLVWLLVGCHAKGKIDREQFVCRLYDCRVGKQMGT